MITVTSDIFLYLAIVYLLDLLFVGLVRSVRLSDFLGHLAAGMTLAVLLQSLSDVLPQAARIAAPGGNDAVAWLSFLGLLFFTAQLGYNFEFQFFRRFSGRIMGFAGVFVILSAVVLWAALFLIIPGGPENNSFYIPFLLIMVVAFCSIDLSGVMSPTYDSPGGLKKPLTFLIEAAISLDLLALAGYFLLSLFIIGQTATFHPDISMVILLPLLLLFGLATALPGSFQRFIALIERWGDLQAALAKIALLSLFLFAGVSMKIPVLILGFWLGLLFRSVYPRQAGASRQRLFQFLSFFYLFPFVELGRQLARWEYYRLEFLFQFGVMVMAFIVIAVFAGLAFLRRKDFPLVFSLGALPRGELALLILWLLVRQSHWQESAQSLVFSLFIVFVWAVIFVYLLSRLAAQFLFVKISAGAVNRTD